MAQGRFQEEPGFTVPATGPGTFNNTFGEGQFASGNFNLTSNSFTADVFVGMGHSNAHWTGTGALATVAAAEPTVLLLAAVGLVAAVRARRRAP